MAITQAVCTSFKQELLVGTHNFTATTGDTFKIALYTSFSFTRCNYNCLFKFNEVFQTLEHTLQPAERLQA